MIWIVLGLAAGYFFATRSFETVGGVRHFTPHGRKEALARLQHVAVQLAPQSIPGALVLVTAPPEALGATGIESALNAERNGGVVLLSESFLDDETGALFVVTSAGSERAIATDGSGLAVLSIVPA